MTPITDIFSVEKPFSEKAIECFYHQRSKCEVYSRFCKALGVSELSTIHEIPLLPIQAFKDAVVITNDKSDINTGELDYFSSSGTSGMRRSKHYILEGSVYKNSILKGMSHFYDLEEFVILAYTPGYQDNPHSSLIRMLNILIKNDDSGLSRFLPLGVKLQRTDIADIIDSGKRIMLFGAAFGLLDLIELNSPQLPEGSIILETGGMKTYRREVTKHELHTKLANGFGLSESSIHSEYGMAELFSQAYSQGSLWFRCVPWMQVSIRNPENPMEIMPDGEEGLIGVMDMANVNTCSFILTGDKGMRVEDGKFQVLGRWNPVNLRGCNFLIDND